MAAENPGTPIAVVKVGGEVLLDPPELSGLAENIKSLIDEGWQVVVLHGGSPQISRLQEMHGLTPNIVAGRRVTGEVDLQVVKQAVAGEANVDLTSALQKAGVAAFGCHGASGRLVEAVKRPPRVMAGAGPEPIDLGEVGDITGINSGLLRGLLDLGLVPVIATLGIGAGEDKGRIFNINGDTTVAQIALALQAELLLMTTKIGGVFKDLDDPGSRIGDITPEQALALIADGTIQGGMIPKVEEAVGLIEGGVGNIAIVSGASPGTFLAVANGTGEFGTRIHSGG